MRVYRTGEVKFRSDTDKVMLLVCRGQRETDSHESGEEISPEKRWGTVNRIAVEDHSHGVFCSFRNARAVPQAMPGRATPINAR